MNVCQSLNQDWPSFTGHDRLARFSGGRLGLLFCHFALLTGCFGPVSTLRPLKVVSNPSKSVDAVLVEKMTDATVATPLEIYLVPCGATVGDGLGQEALVFRADSVEGIQLNWASEAKLCLRANKARVFLQQKQAEIFSQGSTHSIEIVTEFGLRR